MKKIINSQDVMASANEAIDFVYETIEKFPWTKEKAYGHWLAQTYYYVNHATRILALAAAKCKFSEPLLHSKMLEGIQEEKDHEQMALNDLKAFGFSLEDFEELPETSAYFQTLYHMIEYQGPASLLGYFLVLEGLAATKLRPVYENLAKLYGPTKCHFLKVHCALDVKHYGESEGFFKTCTQEQLELVMKSIKVSSSLYESILRSIMKATDLDTSNSQKITRSQSISAVQLQ